MNTETLYDQALNIFNLLHGTEGLIEGLIEKTAGHDVALEEKLVGAAAILNVAISRLGKLADKIDQMDMQQTTWDA